VNGEFGFASQLSILKFTIHLQSKIHCEAIDFFTCGAKLTSKKIDKNIVQNV